VPPPAGPPPPPDIAASAAAAAAAGPSGLPRNWRAARSGGRTYYHNTVTKQTSYDLDALPPPLPPRWEEAVDRRTGRRYYWNTATRETRATPPPPLPSPPLPLEGVAGVVGVPSPPLGPPPTVPPPTVPPPAGPPPTDATQGASSSATEPPRYGEAATELGAAAVPPPYLLVEPAEPPLPTAGAYTCLSPDEDGEDGEDGGEASVESSESDEAVDVLPPAAAAAAVDDDGDDGVNDVDAEQAVCPAWLADLPLSPTALEDQPATEGSQQLAGQIARLKAEAVRLSKAGDPNGAVAKLREAKRIQNKVNTRRYGVHMRC